MLITLNKLNVNFSEDIESMKQELAELERLERAIENSAHFNLLAGKTQMIGKGKGVTKKERSRLAHTNSIAYAVVERTIRKVYDRILEQNPVFEEDEFTQMFELNKAIAVKRGLIMSKAHDIGHVAMGHEGERAINDFMSRIKNPSDIQAVLAEHKKYFGSEYEKNQGHINNTPSFDLPFMPVLQSLSFEHNELGGILLNRIIEKEGIELSPEQIRSLTLGVLGHSTSRTPISLLKGDLVAQIVRVADKVEYINADYDEVSSLIKIDPRALDVDVSRYMQLTCGQRISETTDSLVEEAIRRGEVNEQNPEANATMKRLSRMRKSYEDIIYIYDGTYASEILKHLLTIVDDPIALRKYYDTHKGVEALYPETVLKTLIEDRETLQNSSNLDFTTIDDAYQRVLNEQVHFKSIMQGENSDRINLMYQKVLQYYYSHPEEIPAKVSRKINPIDLRPSANFTYSLNPEYTNLQRVLEFISLMDDQSMLEQYRDLVERRIEQGPGHGIEPIRMSDIKKYLRNMYDEEAEELVDSEKMGTRSYEEARALCSKRSAEYYATRLTEDGRNARKAFYQKRFEEYDEDFVYLQRVQKADEEREHIEGVQEKGGVTPDISVNKGERIIGED